MFKVICTNGEPQVDAKTGNVGNELVVGQKYNVLDDKPSFWAPGHIVYKIEGLDGWFWSGYFSHIDDIDDGQIEEEWQEQEAAFLDRELAKIIHEYENA